MQMYRRENTLKAENESKKLKYNNTSMIEYQQLEFLKLYAHLNYVYTLLKYIYIYLNMTMHKSVTRIKLNKD